VNPFLATTIKTAIAFFAILLYARILGKQQVGQLTYYDYITGITLGSIAAGIAIGVNRVTLLHLWALTLFAALAFLQGVITERSRPLRKVIEGEPTVVIHNGKVLGRNMAKMRYNMENLMTQLRDKNIFNISDVEYALLETSGDLSVLPKSQKRPVTAEDLNLPTKYEGVPTELIVDGKIIYSNLKQLGLDEHWLIGELKKQGNYATDTIMYASLDSEGKLYIDKKQDDLDKGTTTDVSD